MIEALACLCCAGFCFAAFGVLCWLFYREWAKQAAKYDR